jgi:hypothetical protein
VVADVVKLESGVFEAGPATKEEWAPPKGPSHFGYEWFTRYQHIERMGHQLTEGLLDGDVWVQEKLDGANLSVAYDPDGGVLIASRNNLIFKRGMEPQGFNGAIQYVLGGRILDLLAERTEWILRGEWLVKHSIMYKPEMFHHFYVFDVQLKDGSYLSPRAYEEALAAHGVRFIPATEVPEATIEKLAALSQGPDQWGAEQKEGIVIKRYDFRNRFGRTQWGKIVSADFKERNKLSFGATSKDAPELKLMNSLTPALVNKVIDKVQMEKGECSVKDMTRILHTVWYDLFHEELWDFVKKDRVKAFDFGKARSLAEGKTRGIALARFNGIASATDHYASREEPAGAGAGGAAEVGGDPAVGDGAEVLAVS